MTLTNKNFKVEERNTYSLAALVKADATTSVAQFIQLQTLCYYYDIAIYCSEFRAITCDLLTELNNAAQAGQLPVRANKKGRAYLNGKGVMVFSDNNLKPLPYKTLIGSESSLTRSQIKYINNILLKNYKEKGLSVEERTARLVPGDVTVESITKTMMVIVKLYKITFDLNRSLEELYEAQNKCALAIKANRLTLRRISGESYIENQVICFKAGGPAEDNGEITKAAPEVAVTEEAEKVAIKNIEKEGNQIKEEVIKDVAHATSFFVFSKPSEDKSKRMIYIGNKAQFIYLESSYRTSIKACTALAIKEIVCDGHSDAVIFIDKKAEGFIKEINDYSSDTDISIQELAKEHNLDLQIVDTSNQAYIDFVLQCN